MELNVLNKKGENTGRIVNLNDTIFGIEPNVHSVYLDIKQYLANKRQGTHKSKERSAISGSTRKLGRQKGGGGARRGDINSPLLIGGARVFGPKPRDYSFKLNKKTKILARKSALSYMAKENAITIIEDIEMDAVKTKDFAMFLNDLKLSGRKILLVLPESNNIVYLSARNISTADIVTASNINTYKVLNAGNILLTESSIAIIEKNLNA